MRRILGTMLGLALAAPLAYGQTNVLSQNAVGYVKVTVPEDGLALVRMDFEQLDPGVDPVVENLIGDQVPQNTQVHVWNPAKNGGAGGYESAAKDRFGNWTGAGATYDIERGAAFWIQIPAGTPETEYPVYLMGEVPGANNNSETSTVDGIGGIDAVGYPYPAAIAFTGTTLAASLPANSIIHIWDIGAQGYIDLAKDRFGTWTPPTLAGTVIDPGTAFWVESSSNFSWEEVKPYVWP